MHSGVFWRLRARMTSKTEKKPQKDPHDVSVSASNLDMAMANLGCTASNLDMAMANLGCTHMLLAPIWVEIHAPGQHAQTV